MIGKDYNYIKKRWQQFWDKENHDRPILMILAKKDIQKPNNLIAPKNSADCWLDFDYVLKKEYLNLENTYFGGEAFPAIYPNLGPDILPAICGGCEIKFGTDTSWAVHKIDDLSTMPPIKFDEENIWFKRIKELTQKAIDQANGEYLVGITDLHTGADALSAFRGPANLCMDMYDYPELFKQKIDEIFEVHKTVITELGTIIKEKQEGLTNWLGIWHPKNDWYLTSCDFGGLISTKDFDEFIIKGLEDELNFINGSIYHLDGPGNLKHLDRLLKLPKLNGIQWCQGISSPPAREYLDVYKKIQVAGKCMQIYADPEDMEPLCWALEPEGVNICINAKNEAQANELIALCDKIYKKKNSKRF